MIPRPPTDDEARWWAERNRHQIHATVIGGPAEGDDVEPCPALVDIEDGTVHIAYQLDEIEVAALAQGGTVWLTTWGMVPVHRHEVTFRELPDPGGAR
ncbi:MAG: hypothetical protein U5R31_03185 [Acidimicrobiia bacterium]|nr:hypothetical protein [Acidimicrobiia bacterium]